MSTHTEPITAEQLLCMPNDGMRRELIAGELKEMTPAGHEHGSLAMRFSIPLGVFVEEKNLGEIYTAETGFLLARNPDTVRAPDAAFVARERLGLAINKTGYFPGPPDLAVEVVSPGDAYTEVEEKVDAWLDAGSRMVIVINPRNRTLKVYRARTDITVLSTDDTFNGGDLLSGFLLPVRRIFRPNG